MHSAPASTRWRTVPSVALLVAPWELSSVSNRDRTLGRAIMIQWLKMGMAKSSYHYREDCSAFCTKKLTEESRALFEKCMEHQQGKKLPTTYGAWVFTIMINNLVSEAGESSIQFIFLRSILILSSYWCQSIPFIASPSGFPDTIFILPLKLILPWTLSVRPQEKSSDIAAYKYYATQFSFILFWIFQDPKIKFRHAHFSIYFK